MPSSPRSTGGEVMWLTSSAARGAAAAAAAILAQKGQSDG